MSESHALYQMMRADFLERVRRRSFLMVLACAVWLAVEVQRGHVILQVDGYRGVQEVWHKLNLLNATQYATINNENRIAAGQPIVVDRLRNPSALGEGTNWQDQVFRRAAMQNETADRHRLPADPFGGAIA